MPEDAKVALEDAMGRLPPGVGEERGKAWGKREL